MPEGRKIVIPDISVVIPLAPGETHWQSVLQFLPEGDPNVEVILCQTDAAIESVLPESVRVLGSRPGRAAAMNDGAGKAKGRFLWFLHADSRPQHIAIEQLQELVSRDERALYFHNLSFSSDGPSLMWVNEIGVWLRSNLLRMPFGDQGFFLKKELFDQLGGFDENAAYGEDHLLVWRAHQSRVPVRCTGKRIITSARKYAYGGWGRTTGMHLLLTFKQAAPEFWKLVKGRLT